jgi:hypothetical protein
MRELARVGLKLRLCFCNGRAPVTLAQHRLFVFLVITAADNTVVVDRLQVVVVFRTE